MSNGGFGIEKELCLKIAGDITITAIQSGQLMATADNVADFFSTVYSRIVSTGIKSVDKFMKD